MTSVTEFQDCLDKELSWRIKEISDMDIAIKVAKHAFQRTLLRSSIPLLYAHWEGFIKEASSLYINFVYHQNLSFKQLTDCILTFGIKKHIKTLLESSNVKQCTDVVNFFTSRLHDTAILIKSDRLIETKSNLGSSVFKDIAYSIGIDAKPYETRYNLIDNELLKRRNEIAHGKALQLSAADFSNLKDEVLQMLRWYKTDLENAVVLKRYLRTTKI